MTRTLVALAALVLAAGCAQVRTEHDGLTFAERRARLEAVPAWEMRGRLAVDTGDDAFQGRFSWLQDDAHSMLAIRSLFGTTVLEVAGSPTRMVVTARGEQRVLEDPEQDLSALLGWWLPVESLEAWLLGLPDPSFAAEMRVGRRSGLLEALEQRLWNVEYETYQLTDGLLVPRRLDMAYGPIELRVTVDTWRPTAGRALNSEGPEQHNTALIVNRRWGVAKR